MNRPSFSARIIGVVIIAGVVPGLSSCRNSQPADAAAAVAAAVAVAEQSSRPNVLWILWDTVRADRLGVYGYGKPTTPHLDRWASQARIFENCLSTSCWTVPSHGAMFTGLLPSEHGAHHDHPTLDDAHVTLAELLRGSGYQTYLFSANPHISHLWNFHQGFEVCAHPWDEQHREQALALVRSKLAPDDRSSDLAEHLRGGEITPWRLKASGELVRQGLESWLGQRDPQRPFFAFLNYMEAHEPFIPPERFRRQVMDPAAIQESYRVDRSWPAKWKFVFGLGDYSDRELQVMAGAYDACIAELDALFHELITSLQASGLLDNTIVIVTSDHGEMLGEHHLVDHQYALYAPLLRVPLLIHDPRRVPAGRDPRPVMNYDLFPTLLELCGVQPPAGLQSQAVSLLAPEERRLRFAEYPSFMPDPIRRVQELHPEWDPAAWQRRLRVLVDDPYMYILGSDGRQELYDMASDPTEMHDLLPSRPDVGARMAAALNDYLRKLRWHSGGNAEQPQMTPLEREVMQSLGYVEGGGG